MYFSRTKMSWMGFRKINLSKWYKINKTRIMWRWFGCLKIPIIRYCKRYFVGRQRSPRPGHRSILAPVEAVAFYAYMSKPEPAPSNHHTLIFDVAKTNLGHGYNKYSGTFVAPSAGIYVFTWTINTNPHGAHYINLMVNNAVVGGSLTDTQDANDYDSDSNTAVIVLNQGDNVNLRTTYTSDRTVINADNHAFTSFCGWKL